MARSGCKGYKPWLSRCWRMHRAHPISFPAGMSQVLRAALTPGVVLLEVESLLLSEVSEPELSLPSLLMRKPALGFVLYSLFPFTGAVREHGSVSTTTRLLPAGPRSTLRPFPCLELMFQWAMLFIPCMDFFGVGFLNGFIVLRIPGPASRQVSCVPHPSQGMILLGTRGIDQSPQFWLVMNGSHLLVCSAGGWVSILA